MDRESMEKLNVTYARERKRLKRGKNRHVRIGQVYGMDNLRLADLSARKGKKARKGVRIFDRDPEGNLGRLSADIKSFSYHTSPGHDCYRECPCGKRRLLHKLPYYPDHVAHHALMRVIMPVLNKSYYHDSSASIKGRGIHYAARRIRRYIEENRDAGRLYFGKLDFVKFYALIDQERIHGCLSRKFSDKGIRYLIREAVTALDEGLGIGLYPIQPFANYYTGDLCRGVMARFSVRVFIYCDDIAIVGRDKKQVWGAINFVREYAEKSMRQPLHGNIGVQVIDEGNGLDMVGYRFFMGHTALRKRMKRRFQKKMHNLRDPARRYRVAQSYKGWLMHCDGFNLWRKTTGMKSFKDMNVPTFEKLDADGKRILEGMRTSASMLSDREIIFRDVEFDVKSKYKKTAAVVQVEDNGKRFKFFTCNQKLIETFRYVSEHDGFPFRGTLVRANGGNGLPDYMIQ